MSEFLDDILYKFKTANFVIISNSELQFLLSHGSTIIEQNTFLSDFIRLFQFNEIYFVQEKSPKGEYILRKFDFVEPAESFIKDRLDIYEKMWDGCGCKINYYS